MTPRHTAITAFTVMVLTLLQFSSVQSAEESDGQILKRVFDHLKHFMDAPVLAIRRAKKFLHVGGFPNNLEAIDRDLSTMYMWTELPIYLYFGLEDGTFSIYDDPLTTVYPRPALFHRQPGYSGYPTDPVPEDAVKHWTSCIDESGAPKNCTMAEGAPYIKCIDGCKLEKCNATAPDCSLLSSDNEIYECEEPTAWCPQYTIEHVQKGENLGTVPGVFSCINKHGALEQTPGQVLVGNSYENKVFGNCYHQDGVTMVNSTLMADYAYCGGGDCNPYIGTYQSVEYDPRYRPWYIGSKEFQRPLWSAPYPFFGQVSVGITYTEPIFVTEDSKKVFKGVFAVDYSLGSINSFLSQYQGSNMLVAVIDATEPNYVVAISTGSVVTRLVERKDMTTPCEDVYDSQACTVVRIPILRLDQNPDDLILRRAFSARAEAGFPTSKLIALKKSDELGDDAYISQGDIYEQPNANLKWHIIVVTPMVQSHSDAAYVGTANFYVILTISIVGFVFCMALFTSFFSFRNQTAAQNADWRFTCAFIFGCCMLNLSSLALLGENRDGLCMLRMWLFNLLFATALSPLFVKVWRMHVLLHASKHFRRKNVTNFQAMLYTLPIIVAEALILTIFSFVNPARAVENLGVADLEFGQVRSITCQHESQAFIITQLSFDAVLVLIGCYLAYETRKLDARFGEAKQLAFAMYNTAFTGVVLILITGLVEMDPVIRLLLQAIGVAWGAMFNSAVFVVPRLMDIHRHLSRVKRKSSVHYDKKFVLQGNVEVLVETQSESADDTGKGVSNRPASVINVELGDSSQGKQIKSVSWCEDPAESNDSGDDNNDDSDDDDCE